MAEPCKIVTFTPTERDEYRRLRDAATVAEKAFGDFKSRFQARNGPETRRYAPFKKVEMNILDAPDKNGADGTTHAYFIKEID